MRPTCKTHYGGILIALGRWTEAETELVDAIQAFERGYRGDRPYPLVRLADLRVRQGRYEEAERLMEGVEWHPTARRAAATIALARGDLQLAGELAQLCFEGGDPADPACAPLLELLLRIELAARGRRRPRRRRSRGWRRSPRGRRASSSGAFAELAAGQVAAADGDDRAAGHLTRALETLAALGLPLEAARARLELARLIASGTPDVAAVEAGLALASFEELGAARDADAAAGLLRELGAGGTARVAEGPWDPDETRDGGRLAARGRAVQRGDRGAALHQQAHRGAPRGQHPLQARPAQPVRGGRVRRARARRRPVAR